jgi:hypothetical protein
MGLVRAYNSKEHLSPYRNKDLPFPFLSVQIRTKLPKWVKEKSPAIGRAFSIPIDLTFGFLQFDPSVLLGVVSPSHHKPTVLCLRP